MLKAEEYRTAIKVLREHSCEEMADGFVGFAEQAEERDRKRDQYARKLGDVARSAGPANASVVVGLRLLVQLAQDGWSSPEGIL